jgi:hypothetical protein
LSVSQNTHPPTKNVGKVGQLSCEVWVRGQECPFDSVGTLRRSGQVPRHTFRLLQSLSAFVAAEKVPGFDVLGELVAVVRSEVERLVADGDLEGNDVPEVYGNEIDGEDVEFAGRVVDAGLADDVASVRTLAAEGGGLTWTRR